MVAELVVPCAFALPQRHVELLAAAVMAGSAGGSFELVATWPLCGFFLDIRRTAPHRGSDQLVKWLCCQIKWSVFAYEFPSSCAVLAAIVCLLKKICLSSPFLEGTKQSYFISLAGHLKGQHLCSETLIACSQMTMSRSAN